MKVLDLNLLLYAVNRDSPRHADAKAWLEETLSGDERIGLPWAVILGFIRLSTNPRVVTNPVTTEQAVAVVDSWLGLASVAPLDPGEDHWRILRELLLDTGAAGNLTTDAHLAALAIEHGGELCSTDAEFARFPRLKVVNPLA